MASKRRGGRGGAAPAPRRLLERQALLAAEALPHGLLGAPAPDECIFLIRAASAPTQRPTDTGQPRYLSLEPRAHRRWGHPQLVLTCRHSTSRLQPDTHPRAQQSLLRAASHTLNGAFSDPKMSAEWQGKYRLCLFLLQSRAGLVGAPHARRLEPCEPPAHLRGHSRLPWSRLLLGSSARPQSPGACCPPGPSAERQPPLPCGHPFPRMLIQPRSTARLALPGSEEASPCLWDKALLLGNHIPHPSRHCSWVSNWWYHHPVRQSIWGCGASGGLQAPASAFWPWSEAVPGELVDDGAEGGKGQGSKSRHTRAWW